MENLDEQLEKIKEFLERDLKRGDSWYLLDTGWFKKWKKYVGYDQQDRSSKGVPDAHPGPIDNSPLLKDDGVELKAHLIDELDYVLLPTDGWLYLVETYGTLHGGKDIIQRPVIEQGMYVKQCKVEVYLKSLKLGNFVGKQMSTEAMSRCVTIEFLELMMREKFNITDDVEVRLWNKYMSNTYEPLNKREQTLQEAGLYDGQIVLIETRNQDGSWPRGGSGKGFKVTKEQRQKMEKEKEIQKQSIEATVAAQGLVQCNHGGCERPAHLYCTVCRENLCPGCAGLHMMKKSKRGHNVVEYQSKATCRTHVYCKAHDHVVCELYCEQCKLPVCSKCLTGKSHKGHDFREMATVLDAQSTCVEKDSDGIKNYMKLLQEKIRVVDDKLLESEEKYATLVKDIDNREKELLEAVKTAATQRRQIILNMKTTEKNQIQAEKNKLNPQITKAKQDVESCEKLLQNQDPDQLLSFESRLSDFQVVPEVNLDLKNHFFSRGSMSAADVDAGFGDVH